jgi:hypothetical protein
VLASTGPVAKFLPKPQFLIEALSLEIFLIIIAMGTSYNVIAMRISYSVIFRETFSNLIHTRVFGHFLNENNVSSQF